MDLLVTTLQQATRLRVEVFVSIPVSTVFMRVDMCGCMCVGVDLGMPMSSCIPLNSPVHGSVGNQERGCDVEHLVPKTTEGIEDGSMAGTGQRTLAVRRERVGGDTLGSRAACSC